MIPGKAYVKNQRSIYISELDTTVTQQKMAENNHMLLGFMNEKELNRVLNLYPEYENKVLNILQSLK